jgi:hypothetical protein
MAGGLMQLVAYGAQDVYLTANPQITFWKVTYRRYTNFAMESIEQTFNGAADFGRRVQCTLSRNGDLAYRTYLEVTLPEIKNESTTHNMYARWLDYPGEQLIDQVEVEIGGQRIDRQYGQWMHIWNQLTMTKEQEAGYNKMVGHTTALTYLTDPHYADIDTPCAADGKTQVCEPRKALPATTLYVPLQFWFCRNPGLALPLIALQYHEVKINITFNKIEKCLWAGSKLLADVKTTAFTKHTLAYQNSLLHASLFVDYIFLDTDERRRMAQNPHEYLIEQLQFTGEESVGSSSNKIKLNFNHPCKELVWVAQKDELIDECNMFEDTDDVNSDVKDMFGCQYFNYTDAIDVLPKLVAGYGSVQKVSTSVPSTTPGGMGGDFGNGNEQATLFSGDLDSNSAGAGVGQYDESVDYLNRYTDAAQYVVSETSRSLTCWGTNPVVSAKLQLNGQDRFSDREGSYFDTVQPYQHHTRHPDTGINVYSFALRPEEHQPSGTCNFSRIDNATLQLSLSYNMVKENHTAKVRVYAVNYNVLRIMSGMGGLAYSN